jgi:hypothetical protein
VTHIAYTCDDRFNNREIAAIQSYSFDGQVVSGAGARPWPRSKGQSRGSGFRNIIVTVRNAYHRGRDREFYDQRV